MDTYCDLSFRSVAESCRVMASMKPATLISNCLAASKQNQYPIVFFFYPPASEMRLSDEDLREIFYHLTDAHIEEVDENPDPIHLLSKLSQSDSTTMSTGRVVGVIKTVLEDCDDNEQRAEYLRPLFNRIESKDLYQVFMRLSVKGSIVRRRHIIAALASVNGTLFYQTRRATLLAGLKRTCSVFSTGSPIWSLIQPKAGVGLVIPSPAYVDTADSISFTECYMEYPEGEWMSLHVLKDGGCMLFDSSGKEISMEKHTIDIYSEFPEAIYLVEYASGREMEIMVSDIIFDGSADFTYESRRETMTATLPKWAIKEVKKISDPIDAMGEEGAVILWNKDGIHTFENTHYEMVVLTTKKKPKHIFRIVSGRWVESIHGHEATMIGKWRIAARDGESYYPVGLVEAEPDVQRRLKSVLVPSKSYMNDDVKLEHPVFVEVDVNTGGWGDYGPYIHGRVVALSPQSGRRDCVGIDEIEMICGGNAERDGE